MIKNYDIVIIGGGVAGNSAALGLVTAGKSVAVIENDLWGGTCPNRGCDPKKILYSAVEAQNLNTQLMDKEIIDEIPKVNWPKLIAFKNEYTNPVSKKTKENLKNSGVTVIDSQAEFIDEQTVKVANQKITADKFIIATGARPSILDIEGKEHLLTSREFLDLSEMPDIITFIGGGYIGFEFAAIANAAGAKVHLIHHNASPLKDYDPALVQELMKQLENNGVSIHLEIDINQIQKDGNGYRLSGSKDFKLKTNLVFVATGRLPNTETLNLDEAGVKFEKTGIQVDDYLQTTNPSIYAMGDVVSKKQPKLTPVASLESSYLVNRLTGVKNQPITYPNIPTIVFSNPKMTQIGVTAVEVAEKPKKYEQSTIDATGWFSYFRLNEPVSIINIVVEKESNLLVGASIINSQADELMNLFSMLINKKVNTSELSDIIFTYPSIASDLSSIYTR